MTTPELERQVELGQTFVDRGLHHQAVETLREVLSLDPDHPTAHAVLAVALLNLRRWRAADHEAARALTCDPDNFEANLALARIRLAQRRFDEAQAHLTWCLDHRGGDAAALGLLGELRLQQRRPREAQRVFEEALERAPNDVAVIVRLGRLAFDEGDLETASRRADAAGALRPEDPSVLVLRGRLLLRQGAVQKARRHAISALRGDASHVDALALLTEVKAKEDWADGVWWRLNVWMGPVGAPRSLLILGIVHLVFCVLYLVSRDLGQTALRAALETVWLAMIVYSWAGPMWFRRTLDAELGQVRLREDA